MGWEEGNLRTGAASLGFAWLNGALQSSGRCIDSNGFLTLCAPRAMEPGDPESSSQKGNHILAPRA